MNGKVIWENLTAIFRGNHQRRRVRHMSLMGRSRVWFNLSLGSDLCFVSHQVPERVFETVSRSTFDCW